MMTLQPFQYHVPKSLQEALEFLHAHGSQSKIIAGGTDLVPSMKQRLFAPEHLVGLKGISELHRVERREGHWAIGAMVTLAEVVRHSSLGVTFPSLKVAASQIAGPQLQEMGTVGGNVALDTRCVYYNQTYFWRKALGFCLKKDGTVCHVVKGGQKCVAAASNDTAPVLLTLGASVRLDSTRGSRVIPLEGFYVADGVKNTVLEPDELLVEVQIPEPTAKTVFGYQKLRIRASVDYPALTVAVAADIDDAKRTKSIRMAVSALGSRPMVIKRLDDLIGRELDPALIEELGQMAFKQCHPLTNINVDPLWRRKMIPVFVRRAWAQALARQ